MSLQALFNTTLFGIRNQGGFSVVYDDNLKTVRCKYRTESGRRCAAGHHISDGKYKVGMEGTSIQGVKRAFPDSFNITSGPEMGLMISMQHCHDRWACRTFETLDTNVDTHPPVI